MKGQENLQLYARAAQPILAELEQAGFPVQAVGDLVHSGAEYRVAIPILLKWLPLVSYPLLKEDIVRTLSVPWAKPLAAPPLIEEFKRVDDPHGTGLRWAIANALEVVADDDILEEVIQLVRDPSCGRARGMLALALGNMKSPRAVSVLLDLLRDEEILGHAVIALGKSRRPEALPDLEALTEHPEEWVRQEATKALARIRSPLA